jgi:hypothetical protein
MKNVSVPQMLQAPTKETNKEAQAMRQSAERHERTGRPVMALLFRNEACRLEGNGWKPQVEIRD